MFAHNADDRGALLCASELVRNFPKFARRDFKKGFHAKATRAYVSAGMDARLCTSVLCRMADAGILDMVKALLEAMVGEGLGVT